MIAFRRSLLAVALAAAWCLSLVACSDSPAPPATVTVDAPPAQPELITLGETQPYRERIAQGLGDVAWASAYSSPAPEPAALREDAAHAAIKASAQPLAAVDYTSLALPDWVTATRKLQLSPGNFTGNGVTASEIGSVSGEPRFVLYEWRGPEIPQRDDRRLVYRWVYVYALYDIPEAKVTRVLATIRGEAHE